MLTWKMVLAGSSKVARVARSDDKAGNVYTRNSLFIKGLWVCGKHPQCREHS